MSELFRSSRLSFHAPSMDDLDALAAMWADPVAMRYVGDGTPWSRGKVQQRLERAITLHEDRHMAFWTVRLIETGKTIGQAGIVPIEHNTQDPECPIELGYRFGQVHWGKGYATEAARAVAAYTTDTAGPLALERLIAVAFPDNAASCRVLERTGFTHLGETDDYYNVTLALYELHAHAVG